MEVSCTSLRCTRWWHSTQYHSKASRCPRGRANSTTRPTLSSSGRCGECRTCGGRRKTSPSRMWMSRGGLPSSSMTRSTMSPLSW